MSALSPAEVWLRFAVAETSAKNTRSVDHIAAYADQMLRHYLARFDADTQTHRRTA